MKRIIILSIIALVAICSCSKKEYESFSSLYGVIADSETSEPIENASVTLSPGGKNTITGADGRYEFSDLEPRQYTIAVQKTGYNTNRKTATTLVAEKIETNITLTKNK